MHIHYISPSTLPSRAANSVHVVWQCEGLNQVGAEITLYAKRAMAEAKDLKSAIETAYGVAGGALNVMSFYSASSRGDNLRIANMAIKAIRRNWKKGDAILSRNLYASFVLAVLYRFPLLFETHQLEQGVRKWMQRAVMRCPWVTTISISNHLVEHLTKHHGVPARRSIVLHDAAPSGISPIPPKTRRTDLTTKVPEAGGSWRLVCGYFGHLYKGRGIEIVEAMAAARTDCLFLVYGGTESDIEARRTTNRLPNLLFMGHVPHPVARELMLLMDVLLMPYQTSVSIGVEGHDTARWMSPMKMFEYLGSGVPFISSDLPVLREVLRDGENCLLAAPSDVKAWLAALNRLSTDSELAIRIGESAHDEYLKHYTWTRRAEKIITAVEQL